METCEKSVQRDTFVTIHISSSAFSVILFAISGVVSAILLSNIGIVFPTGKYISRTTELSTLPTAEVQKFDYGMRNWPIYSSSKPPPALDVAGEVLAALHQALDAKFNGKREKARKLFQHALALDPNHADALNEYGEFIEEEDVLKANHLYSFAVVINDTHSRALMNRERTSATVSDIDQRMFTKIDEKLEKLGGQIPENSRALQRAQEEFYYLQIYHTTAIEGNTLSLEQMRSIMETGLAIGGKSIMEHNEVLGLDAALHYINNTLMHRFGEITLADILQIHKRVLGFVDPIEAGQLRTTQVFVGGYVPPSSREIEDMLDEFVEWMNSEEALALHPVEFAALAHYKFVYIHPFMDGNGRTSRLLMNLILMRAGYPPVIVKLSQRPEYYEKIKQANVGDIRPFIRFICKGLDDMLDAYLWTTSNAPNTLPEIEDGKRLVSEL